MSIRSLTARLTLATLLLVVAAGRGPAQAHKAPVVRKVYPVADLIIPLEHSNGAVLAGISQKPDACPKQSPGRMQDQLIQLITSSIAPKSWSVMGGPGTIDYFPLTDSFVINQTPAVHERIADLLTTLRRQLDTEVALEIRFVTVSEGFLERIGIDFGMNLKDTKGAQIETVCPVADPAAAIPKQAILTDEQVFQFMEAAQGDQRTNIMQAPKLTVFNGQAARFGVTDQQFYVTDVSVVRAGEQAAFVPKNEAKQTGVTMTVQPTVSADRSSVNLYLKMDDTRLASPAVPLFPVTMPVTPRDKDGKPQEPVVFTQYLQQPVFNTLTIEKALKIPEGKTALLGGCVRIIEGRNEYGPPVLSKVPYINRLFKNVGYTRENEIVMLLVTPRVIVEQEGEERQAASRPTGGAEESEEPPAPADQKAAHVAQLVKKYRQACADGHMGEARKLARKALALDPMCFKK